MLSNNPARFRPARSRHVVALCTLIAALISSAAHAASSVVNSTDDTLGAGGGIVTLRDAITAANTGGGTITFDATVFAAVNGPYTIQLATVLPDLASDITITGPGANLLTVRGPANSFSPSPDPLRVFVITSGKTVSISGLTISNGAGQGTNGAAGVNAGTPPTAGATGVGGGIYNSGSLALADCVLKDNHVNGGAGGSGAGNISQNGAIGADGLGGAIYSDGTSLTVTRCTFSANSAIGGGGGSGASIQFGGGGSGAGAAAGDGRGGAIYIAAGTTSVTNSTFSGNDAVGGYGGGGGAANFGSAENAGGAGGDGEGGAIYTTQPLTLVSCTIALGAANPGNGGLQTDYNHNATAGTAKAGGIYAAGAVTLSNTIVAANTTQTSFVQDPITFLYPTAESDGFGTFISGDFNLIGEADTVATFTGAADQTGTVASPLDPKVDPLGALDNGGTVTTLRLRKGSPAVDKGKNLTSGIDEKGDTRPHDLDDGTYSNAVGGDGSDIGAYEAQALPNDTPVITSATTSIYGSAGADITTANGSTSGTASGTNNQLVATDGDTDTLTFSIVAGTMPTGLTFNSDGTITGTPTAPSQVTLTYKVNDGLADSAAATLKFYIKEEASSVVNTDIDNSTDYDGLTSLRETLNHIYLFGANPTITFDPTFFATAKTITLNSSTGALGIVDTSVTITGPAAGVTISGGGAVSLLQIMGFGSTTTVNVNDLTFADGVASPFGSGGGALQTFNFGSAPGVTFTGCTFTNNSADNLKGGAILVGSDGPTAGGTLTLKNCTFSGNHADGTFSKGGAIQSFGSSVTVLNCTIANNHATSGTGGGISIGGGTLSIGNSIIAGNAATAGPDISGTVTTQGYNIIGNTTGATVSATTGDQFNVDPGLDPAGLADNGGPTQTIALTNSSIAIDQGKALGSATTDQRGEARPTDLGTVVNASGGDGSDIGAFEFQVPPAADLSITVTDGVTTATPGGSVTYTITVSNAGPDAVAAATVADTFPASLSAAWTGVGAGGGTGPASGSGDINESVSLPSGGSFTFTVSATISSAATGSLSNTATVSSSASDSVPDNNSATDTDTLTPSADLSISKTDGVTIVAAGGSVTYTIIVANSGPSDASGATAADTFPATLGSISWTGVGAGGGTGAASGSGNISESVNLPAGGSFTFTVSATLSGAASGSLSNTATITAPGGVTDPTPGNNSATDTDTIITAPTVTTPTSASIGTTAATLGGDVTSDGGSTVTERGVVYSITSANNDPQIDGTGVTKVTGTGTTGVFTVSATGLSTGTAYSYAAYATNGIGTTYSSVDTFTTVSTNADLSGLGLSAGTLTPGFASGTASYTASVTSGTSSLTVTPTAADGTATIKVNGTTVVSGNASGAINIPVGSNPITVVVTAGDGVTTKTYTVTVTRPQIPATVSLSDLDATYDGNPHAATATTTPAELAVSITYSGSTHAPTSAGEYAVVATITDPSYTGSTTGTLVIAQATQTIAFTITGGVSPRQSVTLSATASSGLPVTFSVVSGSATIDGTTLTITGTGDIVVRAAQAGDDNYLPASVDRTANSQRLSQTISFSLPATMQGGASLALSATASSGLPVTFSVVSGNGTVSGSTLTATGGGNIVVRATQDGDDTYFGVIKDVTIAAQKLAQTITFATPADHLSNDPSFDLVASASSGLPVTFTLVSGPALLSGATVTLTNVAGTVTVRASQAGNLLYSAAADVTRMFTVTAATDKVYTGSGRGHGSAATVSGQAAPRDVTPVGDVAAVLPAGSNKGSLLVIAPTFGLNELIGFTIGDDGSFALTATQTTEAGTQTIHGTGQLAGDALSGSFDSIGFSFSADLDPADGPSAAKQGLYVASALGSGSGSTYTIIGSNNEVFVLIVTPTSAVGGMTTLQGDGSFTLQSGDQSIAGSLNSETTSVTTALTVTDGQGGSTTVNFGGLKSTTVPTDRLVNLSGRAHVGSGEKVLISGFVIQGTSPKPVLIRAVGPGLAPMGVTAPLANPRIRIVRSDGVVVAQNEDWGDNADAAEIAAAAARVGAFALEPGSTDSAFLAHLDPGLYTAVVSGGDGTALAEIYDASENPVADYQRLVNISARAYVADGDDVLIGGLVITGNSPKRVLIRAVGPTLATQGIVTPLADPVLKVFSGGTVIGSNDNWDADPVAAAELSAAATQTGAFALTAGSKDAAILMTLAPGIYTMHVSPASGTAPGIALAEIYEVPESN